MSNSIRFLLHFASSESPEPSEGSDNEKSDCYEEEPRWAVMPVKFGKILDFLGNLASSEDIFSR